MKDSVLKIWPEITWIKDEELKDIAESLKTFSDTIEKSSQNKELREKTLDCWVYAIENSVLTINDLENIPFSLLLKDCKISFMNHKRTAVQLSVEMANIMKKNFGDEIQIDMDILIAGAILIDIGKLLEYEMKDGKLITSKVGKLVRHPFSGLAIADRFNLPPEVQHIIATHSKEGDLGNRTVESIIVHHADFVSFDPFRA